MSGSALRGTKTTLALGRETLAQKPYKERPDLRKVDWFGGRIKGLSGQKQIIDLRGKRDAGGERSRHRGVHRRQRKKRHGQGVYEERKEEMRWNREECLSLINGAAGCASVLLMLSGQQ